MSERNRPSISIAGRLIGDAFPPLVIAEIGINHEGDIQKALQMVDDARRAGCECVKFQTHVVEDEMVPNDVVPGNANESIWAIMERCALTEAEERQVKEYVEGRGMIFLSTPFSRAAANRLHDMDVDAYKIGSGECNNYPLIEHIARLKKPVILSTGMNDISSVKPAVEIFRTHDIPYALLHCTSMYPTPYERVRLGAITQLRDEFPDAVVGLSDHTTTNYTCLAAVALGASVLERHFTSDKSWPGPDINISMNPAELADLVSGSRAIYSALGGTKEVLKEEQATIDFAYACVVTLKDVQEGERFTMENTWVKRPGTGQILAADLQRVLGRAASRPIGRNVQLSWNDITP